MKKRFFAAAMASVFFLSSCATVGTKEPSDAEINAEAAKAYQQVKTQSKMSNNAEWNAIVQRVAHRIAVASGEHFQWEAVLIESPEINAWCMPGGKIAVYTGIMPVVKNEAGLAAVLGHEVAHATLRHGKERYVREMNNQKWELLAGLAVAVGGQALCKTTACRLAVGAGGLAAGFAVAFFDRKFSRSEETQADEYGQMYMAKAGYEPAESVHLWERMSTAMQGKAPPEWLSTHPSDERRRADLASRLPGAEEEYSKAPHHYGLGETIK